MVPPSQVAEAFVTLKVIWEVPWWLVVRIGAFLKALVQNPLVTETSCIKWVTQNTKLKKERKKGNMSPMWTACSC